MCTVSFFSVWYLSVSPTTEMRRVWISGSKTHTSRNYPDPAGRVSTYRLPDNARLLEEQAAGSNSVSRHPGEAGESARQTDPARNTAETAARTGDDTHSGCLRSGRLSASRPRGSSRIPANPSDAVRLINGMQRQQKYMNFDC